MKHWEKSRCANGGANFFQFKLSPSCNKNVKIDQLRSQRHNSGSCPLPMSSGLSAKKRAFGSLSYSHVKQSSRAKGHCHGEKHNSDMTVTKVLNSHFFSGNIAFCHWYLSSRGGLNQMYYVWGDVIDTNFTSSPQDECFYATKGITKICCIYYLKNKIPSFSLLMCEWVML